MEMAQVEVRVALMEGLKRQLDDTKQLHGVPFSRSEAVRMLQQGIEL